MPERALLPLMPALTLGFLLGIIVAASRATDGTTFAVGAVGAVVVLLAGGVSVFRAGGPPAERALVGVLRAAGAVALFACVYLALLNLLRDAEVVMFFLFMAVGLVVGLALAGIRVRGGRGRPAAPTERPGGASET
jgi:hypothetical protein